MEVKFFGPASSNLEDMLEWILRWTGIVCLFLGSFGALLIISSGNKLVSDKVIQFAFSFVSFYMLFFGLFLMAYYKKIVVRPKIRR
jgi:hypothetical protein